MNGGEWIVLLSFKYTLLYCCCLCAYRHMKQLYYACVQYSIPFIYFILFFFSHRNGNEFTFIYFRHSKIINCNRMWWWMFYLIGQQTMHENIELSMAIVFVWVCRFDFFFFFYKYTEYIFKKEEKKTNIFAWCFMNAQNLPRIQFVLLAHVSMSRC